MKMGECSPEFTDAAEETAYGTSELTDAAPPTPRTQGANETAYGRSQRGRVTDAMTDILSNAFDEIGQLPTDFTLADLAGGIEFTTRGVLRVGFIPKESELGKVKVSDCLYVRQNSPTTGDCAGLTARERSPDEMQEPISQKDRIIDAIEDWVAGHPEEATRPLKATLSKAQEPKIWWSAKDILEEIKNDTERGREEYRKLIQLTIDLLTRGRIQ